MKLSEVTKGDMEKSKKIDGEATACDKPSKFQTCCWTKKIVEKFRFNLKALRCIQTCASLIN